MSTIEDLYIKRNDLQPYFYGQVKDSDGAVVDITGATIYCSMKNLEVNSLYINRQNTGIALNDPTNGKFYYAWQGSETATSGKYNIEFEVNPSAGGKFTVPAHPDEEAFVYIIDDLDAT